jgi:hypothetical protein
MCTNWKRFTFKAIMLASLSLFLYGCGGGSDGAPAQRTVKGVVSDNTGGKPFANATVTAYAIDATGNVATTPLSDPVQSDGFGNFVLKIPASYSGGIVLLATGTGLTPIRSVVPDVSQGQVVVISPATDMVYQYVVVNKGGSFTADNIQKAILVLERFFGLNFTQIPPPAIGSSPTAAQQQLLVMTQAINSLVKPGTTIADLLGFAPGTTAIALGLGTNFTNLTAALNTTITNLINQGILPGSYTAPTIVPLTGEPDLSDKTPPSVPQIITPVKVTSSSVSLTWDAATDNVGVTAYYVYRNGVFVIATSALTYPDTTVSPATEYTYTVKARDAAGNISVGSTVSVTTLEIQTYTVSGKVTTGDGTGLASVFIAISGSGSGVFLTDANGNYTITGVREGNRTYTFTPALSGYLFTPVNYTRNNIKENLTGLNFTAVATGTVTGGVTYPPGTIIGGISYPSGIVIGGVTYPTATVIGGVVYPTGTVIGGVTYPNGVIIGGVSYPAGTIVGGVAFPVGAVTAGVTYPSGTVIGGVTYPSGTVNAGITYPSGSVTGVVSYPSGTVIGGVVYPTGTVVGGVAYPGGVIIGGVIYQTGTVVGGVSFPVGAIIIGTTYPTGSFTAALEYRVTIFGNVAGAGVNGMQVTLSHQVNGATVIVDTTTTDTHGDYVLYDIFSGLVNDIYTITPMGYSGVSVPIGNDNIAEVNISIL